MFHKSWGTRGISWLNSDDSIKWSNPRQKSDPPYGLDGLNQSPLKEMPFNGVYRLTATGELTLLTKGLTFPNGIAFALAKGRSMWLFPIPPGLS
jgi:sugar lactone lactonase YvrE